MGYKTFYGPRGSSFIDYILVSEDLLHTFALINAIPLTELFDHCVVMSAVNSDTIIMEQNDTDSEFSEIPSKFVTGEISGQKYVASLIDQVLTHLLQIFLRCRKFLYK